MPADLGPVWAVAVGGDHTCAVRADGRLVCFGWNEDGQCDVLADLGPVLTVAAGDDHSCAVRADGRLVCFGLNEYGQCDVEIPVDVAEPKAATADTKKAPDASLYRITHS